MIDRDGRPGGRRGDTATSRPQGVNKSPPRETFRPSRSLAWYYQPALEREVKRKGPVVAFLVCACAGAAPGSGRRVGLVKVSPGEIRIVRKRRKVILFQIIEPGRKAAADN